MQKTKCFIIILTAVIIAVPAMMPVLLAEEKAIEKIIAEEREEEKERRRVISGENSWLEFHFLLQAQAYSKNLFDPSAGETESDEVWTKEAQIRRARIILFGQATENVTFFLETDDIKIGSQGAGANYATTDDYTTEDGDNVKNIEDSKGTFVQDAYINYKFADELEVAAGMILLPFMHHNRQSAASLLGVDYNGAAVPLGGISNGWRDTGIEIRGLLFETATKKKGLFDYRLGVWRGFAERDTKGTPETRDDINRRSSPRYCGRLQLNIVDPETGFFYSGNYLGKKNIFSIGGGIDFQNFAVRNSSNDPEHYRAWTVDATIDLAINNDYVLAMQGAFVRVKNKPTEDGGYIGKQFGMFAQAGVLIFNSFQPVIKYIRWDDDDNAVRTEYFTGGLNYFIDGHKANIKAEYQMPWNKDHKDNPGEKKATVQFQVFI